MSKQKHGKIRERQLPKIEPATVNQATALSYLEHKTVAILEGLAGTGKTYLAVHTALKKFLKGEKDRIILTRPLLTVGNEKIGFLPGEVGEKTLPYAEQFYEYMQEFLPLLGLSEDKNVVNGVEFIPLAFIRGRNFANSIIILDEAQNTTPLQMKTLLTRVSENSQVYVLGDTRQSDHTQTFKTINGLDDLIARSFNNPSDYFGHVRFGYDDIQRSDMVKHVMKMYGDV